ncbi:hypothetical protein CFOL_v3_25585 [Cephalotus follicularis]|uniref:Uncharacterized protein n=1 Tax=Cephalotus follicularis TaxID=3775 RepID=A0A1Q3CPS3_CEPFO|nr:hypothetical protein CFOL_v3_25585 [Cephalotus follicularis]
MDKVLVDSSPPQPSFLPDTPFAHSYLHTLLYYSPGTQPPSHHFRRRRDRNPTIYGHNSLALTYAFAQTNLLNFFLVMASYLYQNSYPVMIISAHGFPHRLLQILSNWRPPSLKNMRQMEIPSSDAASFHWLVVLNDLFQASYEGGAQDLLQLYRETPSFVEVRVYERNLKGP